MLFHSQLFMLGFLPPALLAFHAARSQRSREWVLVVASLLFYGGWDWRFVPALVGLTLANWLVVRMWARTGWQGWLGVGVAINLGVLGVCKYADFVLAQFVTAAPLGIILPLGVSFFTFQKIGYLLDLRRGDRHMYGLLEFFAFVTFFPQLIAGPIVRHHELIPQFARLTSASWEGVARGLLLFGMGLAKKLLLADAAGQVADPLFAAAGFGSVGLGQGWLGAGAYGLQILFDFSAYSDMAIGLGLMFGLRLPDNFNAPYRAISLREFWRCWHMTLSRWLRDYVYIPLGGNRNGQARNVVLTMVLGGLWHGAAWTFIAWGLAHGVALAINGAWARAGWRMPAPLGWALTLAFVLAAWVLFRAPDFATAGTMLRGMAGLSGWGPVRITRGPELAAAAALALLGPTSQVVAERFRPRLWLAWPVGAALAGLVLLAGGRAPNEFIYFQF